MAPRAEKAVREITRRSVAISPLGLIPPTALHVQTPTFEGSLETLFLFVRERKLDLREVPLAPICEAYFGYLLASPASSLEEGAAALVALAYLLERKAWLLLPVIEEEPEEADALEPIPPTSQEFASAIEALRLWHDERSRMFFRSLDASPHPYELPYSLANASANELAKALERILSRASQEPATPNIRTRRSLESVMEQVLLKICDRWQPLEDLLPEEFTRTDAVYFFLATLELIRLGQIMFRIGDEIVEFSRYR